MSGLDNLRALGRGSRPASDGLLGNSRCTWGRSEIVGEEAILAEFAAHPFDATGGLLSVETAQGAVLIGEGGALVADLYDGKVGRLWRVGGVAARPPEPALDVAFDPDLHQLRGQLLFRLEDHPDLDAGAVEPLLAAARGLVEEIQADGKLRVRAFALRAFGDAKGSAALLSLHTLGNEATRTASFSYAVIGLGPDGVLAVRDDLPARAWSPRL
jgi:hypothetical protein